ncbi:hypothetical protein SSCG_00778 [Streptomyces clavuligerus]|nr:hypothetical protein SSCG_00778 [Streptomyces clavuligerus]
MESVCDAVGTEKRRTRTRAGGRGGALADEGERVADGGCGLMAP